MKKIKMIFHLAVMLLTKVALAQNNLDSYLLRGLANNESIRQQQFALSKNLFALQEAKSLFLPAVNFNSTYTLAGGAEQLTFR